MNALFRLLMELLRRKPIGVGDIDEPTAEDMYELTPVKRWHKRFDALQIKRIEAFLDMISYAEGTDRFGNDRGYNVIVGGEIFTDYSDHPRKSVHLPRYKINSTAAGRYQILSRYWDHYKAQLNLPDFGHESQDEYAIQQIREQRALNPLLEGDVKTAIQRCANIWASFPNAGYGQREVAMQELIEYYMGRLND
jgi:muramidase (phage lysozyme)